MFEQITIDSIDQEWAWSQLVGRSISIGKRHKYCSPLRPDNKPGIWFEYHNSILLIIDFSDRSNSHINCVTAWSRLKGIHWKKALREIYEKQGVRVIRQVKEKVKEVEKIITISECWEQKHQDYWDKRGGRPDFVKGVQAYTIHGERTRTWLVDELCFAYKYSEGKYKIYFPFRDRSEQRFISNLKEDDVYLNYIDEHLLISKSSKDYSELLQVWSHSLTHVQCENCWQRMVSIWKPFESKLVYFDNDKAGLKNGLELAKQINGKVLFIPTVDSLELASKMEWEDFLTDNLKLLLDEYKCTDCKDQLLVNGIPIQAFINMKDYDDLVCNPELNHESIFKWLIE